MISDERLAELEWLHADNARLRAGIDGCCEDRAIAHAENKRLVSIVARLRARNEKLEALCAAYVGHWPPTENDVREQQKIANDNVFPAGEREQAAAIADALEALVEEES